MAIPRTLPAALGAVAFLPTTTMLAIHVILARSQADRASSVRTTAIVAAVLEAIIFIAIPFLSISHVAPWTPKPRCFKTIWFGTGLGLSAVASAVSVSNIVCLSRVVDDPLSTILGWKAGEFLVGSSVALGLAFATQLVFFTLHLIVGRTLGSHPEISTYLDQANRSAPRIKTVPYHETTPASAARTRDSASFDSPTPPRSSGGRSATETMSSIRTSLSHAIRPITSRTRLLSVSRRSSNRPLSLDLAAPRESRSRSTAEEGFDTWDTSAVDPDNRQTVLESSSPPSTRFLETIPASPAPSRSPSPGTALDVCLNAPRTRRRSRSYSPVSSRTIQAQRAAFTQQASHSEAHIHPLFRSDSPVPPPSATPGTVVVAAPNAGQVISDRQSIRSIASMQRLRSESSPVVPSPLSRAASSESFVGVRGRRRAESNASPEMREEEERKRDGEGGLPVMVAEEDMERKMTPPIPEWILTAGSRSSLTGYNSRKSVRTPGESEDGVELHPSS
ncbi:hypothetical protein N657DRAFT_681236 [Parathielavia appendiculata]|uniref:Uncharacterized protein n=1 Tax=Parathielavia appendiculata TaxID=2587402 RepID=A0AAN6TYG3_9PEZI|nr:hypothetical protein N657DRAFT_681236 [Parathielavia appendiculata]